MWENGPAAVSAELRGFKLCLQTNCEGTSGGKSFCSLAAFPLPLSGEDCSNILVNRRQSLLNYCFASLGMNSSRDPGQTELVRGDWELAKGTRYCPLMLLQFLTFLDKDLLHPCFTLVITPKSTFQVLTLSPLESVNILNSQHLSQQSHRSTTLLQGTRTLQLLEQRIWLHLPKAQTQTLFRSLLLPTKCF